MIEPLTSEKYRSGRNVEAIAKKVNELVEAVNGLMAADEPAEGQPEATNGKPEECPDCKGEGHIVLGKIGEPFVSVPPCPKCNGKGVIDVASTGSAEDFQAEGG